MSQSAIDNVTMNQLPELSGPINKSVNTKKNMSSTVSTLPPKRDPYVSKWNILFDNRNEQWISFQPHVGATVYPCYACKDMFAHKCSFVDHVNRRGMLLKYKCAPCKKLLMFYNPCSFLLHIRTHFSEHGGTIDLDHVDITMMPWHLAGLLPLTNIPRLYDNVDDSVTHNLQLNSKFYKPIDECEGKRMIVLTTNDLLFFCTSNTANSEGHTEMIALVLKQVNRYMPRCTFVPVKINNQHGIRRILPKESSSNGLQTITLQTNNTKSNQSSPPNVFVMPQRDSPVQNVPEVIDLDSDNEANSLQDTEPTHINKPKIQVKNLNLLLSEHASTPKRKEVEPSWKEPEPSTNEQEPLRCPECKTQLTVQLRDHFQEINRPMDDKIKCPICGLVSPSACSLAAHKRTHDKLSPFVCPECGYRCKTWTDLNAHMDTVCYHRAKNVRYKCPAKKCGKIFAQTLTFSTHFPVAHVKTKVICSECGEVFDTDADFVEHTPLVHGPNSDVNCQRVQECSVCMARVHDLREHVSTHVQNRDNRIYVYICKYCRSYYRSKHTYSSHLLRCTKLLLNNQVKKEAELSGHNNGLKCKVVKYCRTCGTKIQFSCTYKQVKNVANECPKCSQPFFAGVMYKIKTINNYEYTDNNYVRKDNDTGNVICILCNGVLKADEVADYGAHPCKYAHPVVNMARTTPRAAKRKGTPKPRSVAAAAERAASPDSPSAGTPSPEDSAKKKRKRPTAAWLKNKRPLPQADAADDTLQLSPMVFDGEYKCSLCDYKNESRAHFHKHIQEHRDVSTAYQCMECGECFVVKPSLMKHLQAIHLVGDVHEYLANNECYDKDAVRELEENMRLLPGELKEPVAENQCRICRQFFSDSQELSKHFRVHGMAFLMKKIIK